MRLLALILLSAGLVTAGCSLDDRTKPRPQISAPPPSKSDVWQAIASSEDANRIGRLESAWATGLEEARRAGFEAEIRAEGRLLRSDSGEAKPAPTPGSYSCRLVRLGRERPRGPAFQKFKPFFCYVGVEGELFTIVKQTGSQRPAGRLWEDDDPTRLIFLGSLALGNEEEARAYGEDSRRDMAGVFERVAPFRWRLVIPFTQSGARLDVFELVPVPEQPKQ